MMDPLAPKVAQRFAAQQDEDEIRSLADGAPYESDLAVFSSEDRPHWKGYDLILHHAFYSPEEWDDGDTDNRKQENAGPFLSLEALLKHLGPLKFEWLEDGTLGGKPKKERKGTVTQVDAVISRKDSKPLAYEERKFLRDKLKLKD
jgi:hypothetical protein